MRWPRRRTLGTLHEAGLLCDDSYAAALSVCRLDYGSWELYTAPCGLAQLVRRRKKSTQTPIPSMCISS